ncbi:MAG: phospho-N-acetylmuramoyl-pentapeptide-transferase [Candidatus Brocadiia bacterium]
MLVWLHSLGILGKYALPGNVTIRMLVGAVVGFLVSVLVTKYLVTFLNKLAIYDNANFEQMEHLKQLEKEGKIPPQQKKRKVPSFGGFGIVAGILAGALIACDLTSHFVQAGLILVVLSCALGFADDYRKLKKPETHGMSEFSKLFIGFLIGALVCGYIYATTPTSRDLLTVWLPLIKNIGIYLGTFYAVFFILMISLTSNSVNITDGVDGLAAGLVAIASFTLAIVCYVVSRTDYSSYLFITHVPQAGEMAIIMTILAGACLGFLWHNASPASIYMGDTGSLAIGSLYGFAGLVAKQEMLMLIIGGLFIIEFISSLMQRLIYKATRTRYFPVAPVHITFEKMGWPSNHIVVRAYILGVFLALLALGCLKMR